MTNPSRHGLGALLGLIATPLIAGCFMYGVVRMRLWISYAMIIDAPAELGITSGVEPPEPAWAALGAVLVGALTIGLLTGSRVSPLASLVPGTIIGLVGVLWAIAPAWMDDQARGVIVSEDRLLEYEDLAVSGTILIIGIVLLAASAPPSRWRGPRTADPAPAPAELHKPGPDEDVLAP